MGIPFGSNSLKMCIMNDSHCTKIINAHSIQNSFILEKIQEENHVYMFIKNDFKKSGRKQSSIFRGFCQFHDSKIFEKIDFPKDAQFGRLTSEQYALFHFRALANEYWLKKNSLNFFRSNKSLTRGIYNQELSPSKKKMEAMLNSNGRKHLIKEHEMAIQDVKPFLKSCKYQIEKGKYHLTKSYHFIFPETCHFAVNTHTTPVVNFQGKSMNNFFGPVGTIRFIAINLFPDGDRSHLIMTWHKKFEPYMRALVNNFDKMDLREKKIKISKFIITHAENIVFNPSFINSKDKSWRNNFKHIFMDTGHRKAFFTLDEYPDISLF